MRLIKINAMLPEQEKLAVAADIIKAGRLVIYPTETVYGLGADATNPEAVALVYQVKGRPLDQPLSIAVATISDLKQYVKKIPRLATSLMERFLPGPLTLILFKSPVIPAIVTAGTEKIGIRIPDHPVALGLIRTAKRPIITTSANRTGKPSPNDITKVVKSKAIDLVLDAGPTKFGIESTVLDLTDRPKILRVGAITRAEIEAVIGPVSAKL